MYRLLKRLLWNRKPKFSRPYLVASRQDTSDIKSDLIDKDLFCVIDPEEDEQGVSYLGKIKEVYLDISGQLIVVARMPDAPPEAVRKTREEMKSQGIEKALIIDRIFPE